MINLYVCEHCGSQYDNYDEAYECERSHYMLDFGDMEQELKSYVEYRRNKEIPTKFVAPSQEICKWNEDKQDYDRRRVFGEYKLVRILPEDEVASVMREYNERKAREKAEWDEWLARRKAEKEAKEQTEKAESEAE